MWPSSHGSEPQWPGVDREQGARSAVEELGEGAPSAGHAVEMPDAIRSCHLGSQAVGPGYRDLGSD